MVLVRCAEHGWQIDGEGDDSSIDVQFQETPKMSLFFRKRSLLSCCLFFLFGAVFFFFCRMANSVEMLIVGRLLVGIASGLTTTTLPMYMTELSPLELRGTLGVLSPMGIIGGVAIGQIGGKDPFKTLFHFLFAAQMQKLGPFTNESKGRGKSSFVNSPLC